MVKDSAMERYNALDIVVEGASQNEREVEEKERHNGT